MVLRVYRPGEKRTSWGKMEGPGFARCSNMMARRGELIVARYLKAQCIKESVLSGLSVVISYNWNKARS